MSQEDYAQLLVELAGAMYSHMRDGDKGADQALAFLNRLNSGNPNYTPYQVSK